MELSHKWDGDKQAPVPQTPAVDFYAAVKVPADELHWLGPELTRFGSSLAAPMIAARVTTCATKSRGRWTDGVHDGCGDYEMNDDVQWLR